MLVNKNDVKKVRSPRSKAERAEIPGDGTGERRYTVLLFAMHYAYQFVPPVWYNYSEYKL